MNKINPLVEKQYSDWVYPKPITDISQWVKNYCQICDPSLHYPLIWPERQQHYKFSILVAGCGTSQAAILAYTNPQASVVGIDISDTSLEYSNNLKIKHGLKNLELHKMDLHQASTLEHKFDLAYATNVLHHLPNPQTGLKALAQIIKDDGVICISLYSKYVRAGVYMLQEALRRMNIQQNADGVLFTRQLLETIPQWHPAQPYIRSATRDLSSDNGIIDTFLHKQDRAFSVPEILSLVSDSDLTFQGWTDNFDYYPDAKIPTDHPAYPAISSLPDEEQWAVIELLAQQVGLHSFLVRKKEHQEKSFRINFNNTEISRWIPSWRYLLRIVEDTPDILSINRNGQTLRLTGLEKHLCSATDGHKSCGDIITEHAKNFEGKAVKFFASMWRLGHFTYSLFPPNSSC